MINDATHRIIQSKQVGEIPGAIGVRVPGG